MPDLDLLKQAIENTDGRTPQEVLQAFLPKGQKVGGIPLVDITFGHGLFLSNISHPLSTGKIDSWKPYDIAMALFAFTRSSKELARLVKCDELESALYEFLDGIPMDEIEEASSLLIAHYFGALKTIVPMESPSSSNGQKKTPSDGS